MDSKKARRLNIIIAVFFALAMLVTSYVIADRSLSQNVNFLLIAVWLVPFFFFSKRAQSCKSEQEQKD